MKTQINGDLDFFNHIEILRNITGATAWRFPYSGLTGSLDPKTVTKQVADRQRKDGPMSGRTKQIDALQLAGGQWQRHDLRRTGATAMAELDALPDVVEKCLNHTDESRMKRIYQRATYEGSMREAWKLWGDKACATSKQAKQCFDSTCSMK